MDEKTRRIPIAADHGAFELKQRIIEHLEKAGFEPVDMGVHEEKSVDYPDFAAKVAEAVSGGEYDRGVLLCGTGIGMAIAANKVPGIRAALVHDNYTARMSRLHNDSNILVMGGRVIGVAVALDIVDAWLATPYEGGRHARRLDKITAIEKRTSEK